MRLSRKVSSCACPSISAQRALMSRARRCWWTRSVVRVDGSRLCSAHGAFTLLQEWRRARSVHIGEAPLRTAAGLCGVSRGGTPSVRWRYANHVAVRIRRCGRDTTTVALRDASPATEGVLSTDGNAVGTHMAERWRVAVRKDDGSVRGPALGRYEQAEQHERIAVVPNGAPVPQRSHPEVGGRGHGAPSDRVAVRAAQEDVLSCR